MTIHHFPRPVELEPLLGLVEQAELDAVNASLNCDPDVEGGSSILLIESETMRERCEQGRHFDELSLKNLHEAYRNIALVLMKHGKAPR